MTITSVSSRFKTEDDFWKSFDKNLADVKKRGLPELTESQIATIELNVRPTSDQLKDPEWKEKVSQYEKANLMTKAEPGYHKDRPDKILVFTQPLASGTSISVGTTKNSIMKFWIGVGVLKPKGESFEMTILSQNQLAKYRYDYEPVALNGLTGKNFSAVRVIKKQFKFKLFKMIGTPRT
jgi:hypothetical protein